MYTRGPLAFQAFRALGPNDGGAGGSGSGSGDGGAGGGAGSGGAGGAALTWDDWHKSLTDEQRGLIDGHTTGLRSALQSERTSKGELEKQLREMATKAEKGSEAQTQLTKMADELKASNRQIGFLETVAGAGAKNLKLAWAAAKDEAKYWRADGSLDLDGFKKDFPELFGTTPTPPAHGGAGGGQGGGGKTTMNDFIRQAAGRGG